jgi:hypothetical protein
MALSNTKKSEPAQTTNPGPKEKIRVGMTSVSIWENKDEKTGNLRHGATFDLRYKDAEGNFKSGKSYGLYDLLAHRAAVDRAISLMIEARNGDAE